MVIVYCNSKPNQEESVLKINNLVCTFRFDTLSIPCFKPVYPLSPDQNFIKTVFAIDSTNYFFNPLRKLNRRDRTLCWFNHIIFGQVKDSRMSRIFLFILHNTMQKGIFKGLCWNPSSNSIFYNNIIRVLFLNLNRLTGFWVFIGEADGGVTESISIEERSSHFQSKPGRFWL